MHDDDDWSYYTYTPNLGAAIAFAVLFIIFGLIFCGFLWITTNIHKNFITKWYDSNAPISDIRHYSTYKLCTAHLPMIFGVLLEIIGYIGRAVSSRHPEALPPFAIQTVLLLIAPTLYAASIYMLFGRMAHLMFVENLMIMPARYNTLIFVLGDVFSLLLQASGGGLEVSESTRHTGSKIVTAGLFIQIGFFGIFMINEFLFVFRVNSLKGQNKIAGQATKWIRYNWILIVTSAMILLRSIVRTVEFLEGYYGYISGHEWFLYVFDATPMFLLPVMFCGTMLWLNIYEIQKDSIDLQMKTSENGIRPSYTVSSIDSVSDIEMVSSKL
ncbi:Protein RTA1 [Nakaseomyces bracarensis]|uniref:Protein RTA1 n=1 Tax=Nakaseomyces bracarensis TaxID=273131 RepID=A0ABR4NNJ1_9SACH